MGIKNVTKCKFVGLWKENDNGDVTETEHCQYMIDFNGEYADIDCSDMTEADLIPLLTALGETCFDEETIDCVSIYADHINVANVDSCEMTRCN